MGEEQEVKIRFVIGKGEKAILKALVENGGCVEGMLELINKAYGFRYHTKQYLRGLTRRIYRMSEKGLVLIEESQDEKKGRGRRRKKICITSFGLKHYYGGESK